MWQIVYEGFWFVELLSQGGGTGSDTFALFLPSFFASEQMSYSKHVLLFIKLQERRRREGV